MPKHDFQLLIITQILGGDKSYIAEALFFPEISRHSDSLDWTRRSISENALQILESLEPVELYRRRITDGASLNDISVMLEPPRRSLRWRKPVELRLSAVLWNHGEEARIAYMPSLGIEIAAKDDETAIKLAAKESHAHLLRTGSATSLERLVWIDRCKSVRLDHMTISAEVLTPKQIEVARGRRKEKSVLDEIGTDLTREILPEAFDMDSTVSSIAEILTSRRPRSILLVGPSGVGKTAAVYELVRKRHKLHLGQTPFWATSGSRIVAGMSGFGMWQQRCQRLWNEASKEKAVIYFGNLIELMEVGKSANSTQGIASFFQPYLVRGDLIAIAECTSEQLSLIERADPHLLEAFHQIQISEPSIETGKSIMLSYALAFTKNRYAPIDLEGIETVDRLHQRYATYSARPGRPIGFLKNLLQDRREEKVISVEKITSAFSEQTGLPLFLLEDSIKLDLDEARSFFASRVIGQNVAVDLITNLIATVKARMTRPRKPIASLLFIGPTGVGKTEMAKALAEFFFHDRNRLIRFDMSEYADPISVMRLTGGVFGSEGLLTSKVREQPFSVVLLDEFEKADPSFFDLLLQALGEGRLTDAGGRLADFCNSVVIMTSNLGAESFQRGSIGVIRDSASADYAARHFAKEVQKFVRPELFNRIDRVVAFSPLDEQTILQIAHREMEKISGRDGIRFQNVALSVEEDVISRLAEKGYDARYGARPLKRAIERDLLVPLSEGLNRYTATITRVANATIENRRLRVEVRTQAERDRSAHALGADAAALEIAARCSRLRRMLQRLERSRAVAEIQNDIFRLDKIEREMRRKKWTPPNVHDHLKRLAKFKALQRDLNSLIEESCMLEDEVLLALYGKSDLDKDRLRSDVAMALDQSNKLMLSIYALGFEEPNQIALAVYSENSKRLFELASAYNLIASSASMKVDVYEFVEVREDEKKKLAAELADEVIEIYPLLGRETIRREVDKPKGFFAAARDNVVGILLWISGEMAYPRYGAERGMHKFIGSKKSSNCLVHTFDVVPKHYRPPADIERRGSIKYQETRRKYNFDSEVIEDIDLEKKMDWRSRSLDGVIAELVEEKLMKEARSLAGEEEP